MHRRLMLQMEKLEQRKSAFKERERRELDSVWMEVKETWKAKTSSVEKEVLEIQKMTDACERFSQNCMQLLRSEFFWACTK